MTEITALDAAHAAMESAPEDDALRLAFYDRLAAGELFLMLAAEASPEDENVTPEVFDTGSGRFVLAFDHEERLAAFAGQTTPYVALSGRSVVGMLAGQGLGLGVNLDVAPSAILLPEDAVTWLKETLENAPLEVDAAIASVRAPVGLPETLIRALDARLATAMGLAQSAYLVGVDYAAGSRGHLLAFVGAVPEAEGALARAAAEALTFSGIEAGVLDVAFFSTRDPIVARFERHGLRFDLPQLQQSIQAPPAAPGSDPQRPPKLK